MTPGFQPGVFVRVPGSPGPAYHKISQELQVRASFSLAVRGIVAAFVLAALGACQKSQAQPAARPPPEVTVAVVQPHDLPVNFEYVAQISGVREVEVRPRVSGILEKWNFTEGAKVAQGQSLFTIDAAPFRAALAKAEADLVSAQASMDQAKRNAGRLKPLIEAKAISQKEYDDASSGEQFTSANVEAAQAAVTEARLKLAYTRVVAPIAGIT